MSRRLRVLISAYACEPNKGSEPEVGWQWALQMARFHDVTVLTRANNREGIEAAVAALEGKQPLPRFAYHDREELLLDLKRYTKSPRVYYLLWQRTAHEVIRILHQEQSFDLMHHVTIAGFRYPTAIWGHGVPSIWGPVGGIESTPSQLLPWSHLPSLLQELARNAHNAVQHAPFNILSRRASVTSLTLVSTREMQEAFARLGFEVCVMPTIGLNPAEIPFHPRRDKPGPLRLLFVGRISALKGVHLAIESLVQSKTNAVLTLIGAGDYQPAAERLARRLGVNDRVEFRAPLPRQQLLPLYGDFDALLFPSLHDTGGYAVIEAMYNELPVICLDCGGPAVAVEAGCGIRVPLGGRQQVIAGLAEAIQRYDQNRNLVTEHGRQARQAVLERYDWDKKGRELAEIYQEVVMKWNPEHASNRFTGIGGVTGTLHRVISVQGIAAALVALIVIGLLCFSTISLLKKEARSIVLDTLPGLTEAGEANAYLADASRTLLLVVTDDPARRAKLREEIDGYSVRTTSHLTEYGQQIYADDDRQNFDELLRFREDYRVVREQVIALAYAGKRDEALNVFNSTLMAAHTRLKQAGDKLMEYNIREGEHRGERILSMCTATQVAVAVVGISLFVLGFFIGMFK